MTRNPVFIIAGVILIIAALAIVFAVKGCNTSSSSKKTNTTYVNGKSPEEIERENTISLIKLYVEKGEYDRAMNLLDGLLIKNKDDQEALAMMDEILALKAGASLDQFPRYSQTINLNTQELERAINEMQRAIQQQNAQSQLAAQTQKEAADRALEAAKKQAEAAEREAALREEARIEEQKRAQKQAAEEARRKAEAEELAKKNAEIQKQMNSVNDQIAKGKAELKLGNVNSAIQYFNAAKQMLPKGEDKFNAQKLAEIAASLYEKVPIRNFHHRTVPL